MAQIRSRCRPYGAVPQAGDGPGTAPATQVAAARDGSGRRWIAPVLALALAVTAVPALAGPGTSACWRPGAAPGLFSWSDAPGIACRNGAVSGEIAPDAPVAATGPQAEVATVAPGGVPDGGALGEAARVTFSGTAHVGVAVTF